MVFRSTVRTAQRLTLLFVSAMLVGSLVGIAVPAGPGWDFANFYDTGRRAAAGQLQDIYDASSLIAGAPPQGNMRFWGPPISAYVFAPMSLFAPATALLLFKVENVLALLATFILLFRFHTRFIPSSHVEWWNFAATFSLLCLVFQPFWTVFRVGGQTTPTVLLLLTGAMLLHTRGHVAGSAVCVSMAVLLKPAMAPIMLFLLCVSDWSFVMAAAATLGVVGVASLGLLGWPIHESFLGRVLEDSQARFGWFSNSSLSIVVDNLEAVAERSGATQSAAWIFEALRVAIKLFTVGLLGYLTVQSRRRVTSLSARRHFDFLMALTFFLLVSGTLWEHYLAVLFPVLIYVVASARHFTREATRIVGAIFVLSLGQNLILMLYLRDRFAFDTLLTALGIAIVKSGPLILTALLLWRHRDELFESYRSTAWSAPAVESGGISR